jgi:hypothetical protein
MLMLMFMLMRVCRPWNHLSELRVVDGLTPELLIEDLLLVDFVLQMGARVTGTAGTRLRGGVWSGDVPVKTRSFFELPTRMEAVRWRKWRICALSRCFLVSSMDWSEFVSVCATSIGTYTRER